ncbi:hypothetical protein AAVH_34034 [Aphelenchoides avenae]|nr:hypothetical protein AAVH_34034 [Aphelenchus avenae]
MVNWISGTGNANSSACSTNESKELITREEDEETGRLVPQQAKDFLQLSASKRSNSKKLSVVPEQDEQQLTVTSISQVLHPLNVQQLQQRCNSIDEEEDEEDLPQPPSAEITPVPSRCGSLRQLSMPTIQVV